GLLNVQYALKDDALYVLEANPRASRTVPFVSKATAVPLAKAAARIMLGASIDDLRGEGLLPPSGDGGEPAADVPIAVKEAVLPRYGIECEVIRKHVEAGLGPDAVRLIASGEVSLVINTPQGSGARLDGYEIRSAAVVADIPCITTLPGAAAAVMGIEALLRGEMSVRPLQELHAALRPDSPAPNSPI